MTIANQLTLIGPQNINLRNYPQHNPLALIPAIDGLATQGFERRIVRDINRTFPIAEDQMRAFAYCLSQALSSPEAPFKGLIISTLKTNFLNLAKTFRAQAKEVLDQDLYTNSPHKEIKEIIEKTNYYNSWGLVKFIHHLHGGLKSDRTVSGKAFFTGIGLIFGGAITQLVSEDKKVQNVGIATLTAGALLILSTFVHASIKTYQGEP